jgi:hypothetical protein
MKGSWTRAQDQGMIEGPRRVREGEGLRQQVREEGEFSWEVPRI